MQRIDRVWGLGRSGWGVSFAHSNQAVNSVQRGPTRGSLRPHLPATQRMSDGCQRRTKSTVGVFVSKRSELAVVRQEEWGCSAWGKVARKAQGCTERRRSGHDSLAGDASTQSATRTRRGRCSRQMASPKLVRARGVGVGAASRTESRRRGSARAMPKGGSTAMTSGWQRARWGKPFRQCRARRRRRRAQESTTGGETDKK